MPSPLGHALAGLLVATLVAPAPPSPALPASSQRSPRAGPPGVGAAALVAPAGRGALVAASAIGVAAGLIPDLDFVPGFLVGQPGRFHHGPSHSIGAALAAGLAVAAAVRLLRGRAEGFGALGALRGGLIAGLAWLLHVLLDALAVDTSAPYGVMLWWPLAEQYVVSPWSFFHDVQRRDVPSIGFLASLLSWHNVRAALVEGLLLGPPALLVLRLRHRACGMRRAPRRLLARPGRSG